MISRPLRFLLLLAVCAPAMAQYAGSTPSQGPALTPKNGQTAQQMWNDRYECYRWAVSQSGFDPNRTGASAGNVSSSTQSQYNRAFDACIEGRGYAVRSEAPPPVAPPLPPPPPPPRPAPPVYASPFYAHTLVPQEQPTIKYHPIEFQIDGGYSVAGGTTGNALDGGSNAGLGLTWFPSSALPIGLRVDGSYNWFRLKDSAIEASGYNHGDEDVYGGDADLQFDLAHTSSRYKMYLFGGAGRYKEDTRLRTIASEPGYVCGYFYCVQGLVPVETAFARYTSGWLNSWNAGIGFETAVADNAKFFIEARYLKIGPTSNKQQFVPIRVGFRF